MVSVWVFVSSGIKNITLQEKIIKDYSKTLNGVKAIENIFFRIDDNFPPKLFSSWALVKIWKDFDNWGFSVIKEVELDESYCFSWSENTKTNHIFIKTFIPFEEQLEDINSSFESVLTWNASGYTSDQKNHIVKNRSWDTIVWKWIFWDYFSQWDYWTWIYLNSPTWLSLGWDILFISDTLNNRVLAYNIASKKIYKLLDNIDWLSEPTGLYYDDGEKALYISNSWKGEILKYSSYSSPLLGNLDIYFPLQNNIEKATLSFSGTNNPSIDFSNYNKSSLSFSWSSSSEDFLTWSINMLDYFFVDYTWSDISMTECVWRSSWDTVLSSLGRPSKCTYSWTGKTSSARSYDLSKIELRNITWNAGTWSYFGKLGLFRNNFLVFEDYFPYFVQGDGDLLTKNDNILEVFTWWLNYPTWIRKNWSNIRYKEFPERSFSISNIQYDKYTDHILNNPIWDFGIDYSNNLLTLKIGYYKIYNCYNTEDKVEKDFLFKKSFKP